MHDRNVVQAMPGPGLCNQGLDAPEESIEIIVGRSAEQIEMICIIAQDIRMNIIGTPTCIGHPTIGDCLMETLRLHEKNLYEIKEILTDIRNSL